MRRSFHVISRMVGSYLLASVLDMVVVPFNELTGGIVLGHVVSERALSVIGIVMPVNFLFYALRTALVSGCAIIAAKQLGAGDRRGASDTFTVSMAANAVTACAVLLSAYAFLPSILSALCREPALMPLLTEYARAAFLLYALQGVLSGLNAFIRLSGCPILVSRTTIVSSILNFALLFAFVGLFDMGIAGAAWATIASRLAVLVLYIPYLRNGFAFRLTNPGWGGIARTLKRGLRLGIPNSAAGLTTSAVYFAVNRTVSGLQGEAGMFAWAVLMQAMNLCEMIALGFSNMCQHVGGVLMGDRDYWGLRMLVWRAFVILAVLLLSVSLFVSAFPGAAVALFGMKSAGTAEAAQAFLRTGAWMLLPFFLCAFVGALLVLTDHVLMGTLYPMGMSLCLVTGAALSRAGEPRDFWWISPLLMAVVVTALFVQMIVASRRDRQRSPLAFVPLLPDDVGISVSVGYGAGEDRRALDDVCRFVSLCELGPSLDRKVRLACGEIVRQLADDGREEGRKGFFDLRVTDTVRTIEVEALACAGRKTPLRVSFGPGIEPDARRFNGVNVYRLSFEKGEAK